MASVLAKEREWDVSVSTGSGSAESGADASASERARVRGGVEGAVAMKPIILGPFKDLRDGVNNGSADFFMWEHFTTKSYWTSTAEGGKTGTDAPELKWVGEIYTPWPSWHIVASTHPSSNHSSSTDSTLDALFAAFDEGIRLFHQGGVELAVKMLGSGEVGCHYTESDTREWMEALKFAERTRGVDSKVMENVVAVLKGAGVIEENVRIGDGDGVVGIER
jgi:hypothetical protein